MTHRMPQIAECDETDCSYNIDRQCHTLAITVGDQEPCCDTYFQAGKRGGFVDTVGGVGACKTSTCTHNKLFECTAESIHVKINVDHPDCGTYLPRQL